MATDLACDVFYGIDSSRGELDGRASSLEADVLGPGGQGEIEAEGRNGGAGLFAAVHVVMVVEVEVMLEVEVEVAGAQRWGRRPALPRGGVVSAAMVGGCSMGA